MAKQVSNIFVAIKELSVGGKKYFTVSQMAAIINRSTQTVYALVSKGNIIRKMKSIKIADRVLIPVSELTQFPFTSCGMNNKETVYYYNSEGRIIEEEKK